jgi:transglutaminase-like putative cysteine protease
MKTTFFLNHSALLALLMLLGCRGIGQDASSGSETYYYAVEINGIICGYSESEISTVETDGRAMIMVEDDIQVKMTLLGQDVDISIRNEYKIDSSSGLFTFCKHVITAGVTNQLAITQVDGTTILFTNAENGEPTELTLDPDVILESPLSSPHLMEDFVQGDYDEREYRVYDDMRGEVVNKVYTRVMDEELTLAGKVYNTTVLDELNLTTGIKTRLWICQEEGFPVKIFVSGRTIYLADESVKKKIRLADMDKLLFAKVNTVIPDIHNITYMKVKAEIQSAGEWITAEGLNGRGQVFTGTVEDNFIEGVFDLTSLRYDGDGAPAFPYDYPLPDSLQEYVMPGKLIESDHPDLVKESTGITAGSSSSWEAAIRLSRWVSDNVTGAIPGGTSAINTYRTRQGECGSHSRLLAALCRASGIPARLAIGCMYSTYLGGSFGQHAWTEVFMGDSGWIAIDATAEEYDYIDAGHIRLGEETSFNPKSMEILEYRVGTGEMSVAGSPVPEKYKPYTGKYTLPENGKVFNVLFQDGSLVVDIPDRMMLALNDPDEEGRWYPKLTRQINFKFLKGENGRIVTMQLQQLVPVTKQAPVEDDEEVGAEILRPYTGKYVLQQANAEFTVTSEGDTLYLDDPVTKQKIELMPSDEEQVWNLKDHQNKVKFEKDPEGNIQSMTYYEHIFLTRGEPVSGMLKEWIDALGIEEGMRHYREMEASDPSEFITLEPDLNRLGYDYLNNGALDEAIAVFQLNAAKFPESWNVYDSLGEAFMKRGNKDLAIKNYEQSIRLNPENENGKKVLDELNSDKF